MRHAVRTAISGLAALLCAACVGEPFSSQDGGRDGGRADGAQAVDWGGYPDFPDVGPLEAPRCEEVIDVVFAIDLSSSMTFVLTKLAAEIDAVVNASNALREEAHFGLVPFVDNHVLDTAGPLEGGKVHVAADTLRARFEHYRTVYTDNDRNPGDGPSGPTLQNPICEESSLDAIYAAVAEFPWRETATRIVILATDDTFLERPDNYGDRDADGKWDKLDFPREGNYPAQRTLGETAAQLKSARVRLFAFTKTKAPGFLELPWCGTGRRLPWTAISDGWTTPYKGQPPLPAESSGKAFDLDLVRDGQLSLSETINNVVLESHCKPIL